MMTLAETLTWTPILTQHLTLTLPLTLTIIMVQSLTLTQTHKPNQYRLHVIGAVGTLGAALCA